MNEVAATETDSPGNTAGRSRRDKTMAGGITLSEKYADAEWNNAEQREELFYQMLDRFLSNESVPDADKYRAYALVSENELTAQSDSAFNEPYATTVETLREEGVDFEFYEKT